MRRSRLPINKLPIVSLLPLPLNTSLLSTVHLRIKIIAYSSIAYMHYCTQKCKSKRKTFAVHTTLLCINCIALITLLPIDRLPTSIFAHK